MLLVKNVRGIEYGGKWTNYMSKTVYFFVNKTNFPEGTL